MRGRDKDASAKRKFLILDDAYYNLDFSRLSRISRMVTLLTPLVSINYSYPISRLAFAFLIIIRCAILRRMISRYCRECSLTFRRYVYINVCQLTVTQRQCERVCNVNGVIIISTLNREYVYKYVREFSLSIVLKSCTNLQMYSLVVCIIIAICYLGDSRCKLLDEPDRECVPAASNNGAVTIFIGHNLNCLIVPIKATLMPVRFLIFPMIVISQYSLYPGSKNRYLWYTYILINQLLHFGWWPGNKTWFTLLLQYYTYSFIYHKCVLFIYKNIIEYYIEYNFLIFYILYSYFIHISLYCFIFIYNVLICKLIFCSS